jgi:hypothetical protein
MKNAWRKRVLAAARERFAARIGGVNAEAQQIPVDDVLAAAEADYDALAAQLATARAALRRLSCLGFGDRRGGEIATDALAALDTTPNDPELGVLREALGWNATPTEAPVVVDCEHRLCEGVAQCFLGPQPSAPTKEEQRPPPTIEEVEDLLNCGGQEAVEILPTGEVRWKPTTEEDKAE